MDTIRATFKYVINSNRLGIEQVEYDFEAEAYEFELSFASNHMSLNYKINRDIDVNAYFIVSCNGKSIECEQLSNREKDDRCLTDYALTMIHKIRKSNKYIFRVIAEIEISRITPYPEDYVNFCGIPRKLTLEYEERKGTDFLLRVTEGDDTKTFSVHKKVLAHISPVMKNMFGYCDSMNAKIERILSTNYL